MFIVRACYRGADVQAEGSYGSRGRQKALDRYLARATPSRRVGSCPGALGYEVRGGAIRSDASRIPLAWEVAKASQSEARATTRRVENRCWQVCLPAESSRARFECASKYGRWQGREGQDRAAPTRQVVRGRAPKLPLPYTRGRLSNDVQLSEARSEEVGGPGDISRRYRERLAAQVDQPGAALLDLNMVTAQWGSWKNRGGRSCNHTG
jgi:hypothetical protein